MKRRENGWVSWVSCDGTAFPVPPFASESTFTLMTDVGFFSSTLTGVLCTGQTP